MLPTILKTLTRKMFARAVRPRPTTYRRPPARLGCEAFEDRLVPAALVVTDQEDSALGSPGVFPGGGFAAGRGVPLKVTPAEGTAGSTAAPETRAGRVTADADGSISTEWAVTDPD